MKQTKEKNIKFDYNNCLSSEIGNLNGLTLKQIKSLEKKSAKIKSDIIEDYKKGKLPFIDLPLKMKDADEIIKTAKHIKSKFDYFLVLGIGGSALGNIFLQNALNSLYYNEIEKSRKGCPKIYVLDNVDPDLISETIDSIDLNKTCINVITKSGSTAETMSQFLIFKSKLERKLGKKKAKENIIITTDKKNGVLRKIADTENIKNFIVPEGVGGRFTVLSPVGLLSAAVAGINIKNVLQGASHMRSRCLKEAVLSNPACLNGIIHYLMDQKKDKSISVIMPYSNHLFKLADWYRQLWAESLGKKMSLNKKNVYVGQTPVNALGATDQHSQVQLYTEGPFDKLITFIQVEKFYKDIKIPSLYKKELNLGYLGNKKISELINSELLATEFAVKKSKRPSVKIILPEINPHIVGQLIFMYEFQTVFTGGLYNINPLDQPGVEAGKKATYTLMERDDYKHKKALLLKGMNKNKSFII